MHIHIESYVMPAWTIDAVLVVVLHLYKYVNLFFCNYIHFQLRNLID